jgi:hypothetical protein
MLAEAKVEGERVDWPENAEPEGPEAPGRRGPRNYNLITAYARAWVWSLAAMALAFGVFMVLRLL